MSWGVKERERGSFKESLGFGQSKTKLLSAPEWTLPRLLDSLRRIGRRPQQISATRQAIVTQSVDQDCGTNREWMTCTGEMMLQEEQELLRSNRYGGDKQNFI
jgi:hypothetical protein